MEDKTTKQSQFIESRAKGNSFDNIAKTLGVSKSTLIQWSKDYREDVDNMRAIEREALAEQYKITSHHQLEQFGIRLTKIREEVAKRDLSDVPTDKLITMEIKIAETVKNLGIGVTFNHYGYDRWKTSEVDEKWDA